MRTQKYYALFTALFLSIGVHVYSQISITSSDILNRIGTTQELEFEEADDILVDVGSAGENQQWSLMQVISERSTFEQIFVSPENTRFSAEFPNANFALSIMGIDDEETGEIELYEYFEVMPNSLSALGIGIYSPQLDTSIINSGLSDMAPLPLSYNTSWMATEIDTLAPIPGFSFITMDTTINTVDGWGTLMLPSGTFDCLRIRAETRCREINKQGETVINEETSSSIQYTWISKDHFILAHIESQENEPNLNFTNAFVFQRLVQSTTPVLAMSSTNLQLNNYPNPVKSSTTFTFHLPRRDQIKLQLFDTQGREVAVVANDMLNSGNHRIFWRNQLDPGLYLCQLKTSDQIQTSSLLVK